MRTALAKKRNTSITLPISPPRAKRSGFPALRDSMLASLSARASIPSAIASSAALLSRGVVRDQDRAHRKTHDVNIMIGVTAGLVVTTAILGCFTDWNQARDAAVLKAAP